MRVVIIHDNASISGGAQKVAITEAVALADRGIDVSYFSAVGPVEFMLSDANIPVVCLNQVELKDQLCGIKNRILGFLRGLWNKESYRQLNSLLSTYDPKDTILHIHGWSLALSPSIFKVISDKRFKTVMTCHDYEINCPGRTYFNYHTNAICFAKGMSGCCIITNCDKRSYAQKIYRVIREMVFYHYARKCDLSLIYLSEFSKRLVEKDLRLKTKGYIVPNLIDIPESEEVLTSQNKLYLFIGRLNPEKGGKLFCEAITKAGVDGAVIGIGSEFASLKKQYPNITFYGWKTQQEMVPIIKHTRCLIMTSICYEGAPLTIPEIQCAYALPCIVPSPSGAADYIQHGKNGLIFRSGDLQDLMSCIGMLRDDKIVESMTNECRTTSNRDAYSREKHVDLLLTTYSEIL